MPSLHPMSRDINLLQIDSLYMPSATSLSPLTNARLLRAHTLSRRPSSGTFPFARNFSASPSPLVQEQPARNDNGKPNVEDEAGRGAMSRRLSSMTEQYLEGGGRAAKKVAEEAGFSDELKKQLEDRIAEGTFRSENAAAFAQAEMPVWPFI